MMNASRRLSQAVLGPCYARVPEFAFEAVLVHRSLMDSNAGGRALFIVDHPSHWDGWLAYTLTRRMRHTFLMPIATETWRRHSYLEALGYTPVRGRLPHQAESMVEMAAAALTYDQSLWAWTAAPGQIQRTNHLQSIPTGSGRLAKAIENLDVRVLIGTWHYEIVGSLRPTAWLNLRELQWVRDSCEGASSIGGLSEELVKLNAETRLQPPGFAAGYVSLLKRRVIAFGDIVVSLRRVMARLRVDEASLKQAVNQRDPRIASRVKIFFGSAAADAVLSGDIRFPERIHPPSRTPA